MKFTMFASGHGLKPRGMVSNIAGGIWSRPVRLMVATWGANAVFRVRRS